MMNNLKELVEDFIEYTATWSITEFEWYDSVDCLRQNVYGEEHISDEEFERAIRENILYDFIYDIETIKYQMETDIDEYCDEEEFEKDSRKMEKKIQKIFKDFKLERE